MYDQMQNQFSELSKVEMAQVEGGRAIRPFTPPPVAALLPDDAIAGPTIAVRVVTLPNLR